MGLEALDQAVANLKAELEKFGRGNNSAGTRARKFCQEVKKAVQEIRQEIQTKRKAEA